MNRYTVILLFLLLLTPGVSRAQNQFRETVWMQLGRDIFISGEELEYTLSLLESDTYKASVLSNNVRVEFTDSKGNSILKKNIELTDSKASGSFHIPVNLESGWYIVKSYTNWMRNYPGSEFTWKYIKILNPEDIENDSLIRDNKLINIKVNPLTDLQDPGLLKCGIFTSNESGEAISAQGIVLSGPGDTVMTFRTNNTGWATSDYRPSDPSRYQVFIPGYSRENIKLDIVEKSSNSANTSFSQRYGYIGVDMDGLEDGSTYKVLVHRMYSWSWFQTASADNGKLAIRIPVRDLPSGISQISILDKDNKIIFKQLWSDYNEESASVLIEKDSSADKTARKQVFECYSGGSYDTTGVNLLYILANSYITNSTINNYLPGLPGWPANYSIPSAQAAFDAWISSNSYPDKIAEAFFSYNPDSPESTVDIEKVEYLPETRGGILQGRVYRSDINSPVENTYLALTILNDNSHYAVTTDRRGKFVFYFPEHRGSNDYLINFIEEYDPTWLIEFKGEYDTSIPVNRKRGFFFSPEELAFLRQQKLSSDLSKIYYPTTASTETRDSLAQKENFYGNPDLRVKIDDYIQLPNLREVIYEVVPNISITRHKKLYEIKIVGDGISKSRYPTLILLDGIPLYDYQDMLNLPPERIDYIDVVTTFYIHGNAIFEGIVNIKSVNNDFGGLLMPSSTILSSLSLPQKKEYYPLEAKDSEVQGMPSLSTILRWDILKKSASNRIAIDLNDNPGKYRIVVYGFDSEGKWHSGELVFDNPESR